MTLGEVIERLEREDPAKVVANGFGAANSWRGDYACIAFEPASATTVGAMLAHARDADGGRFEGYKGGTYRMDRTTDCYIAEWGDYGGDSDRLFAERLDAMLGSLVPASAIAAARAEAYEDAAKWLDSLAESADEVPLTSRFTAGLAYRHAARCVRDRAASVAAGKEE